MTSGGGVAEVWLVRHTSVDVPPGVCYGRTDVPLRDTFQAEAAAVRDALTAGLAEARFDAVWSSPLSRCTRLAEACGWASARLDGRLLELDFGAWEGRRFDEIADPGLAAWYADYLHARPTGGETFDEQLARVGAFLDELRDWTGLGGSVGSRGSGGSAGLAGSGERHRHLVFTHGGVLTAAAVVAGLASPESAFLNPPAYGAILKLSL